MASSTGNIFHSMRRGLLCLSGAIGAAVGFGYFDTAKCMNADQVENYVPGETLGEDPCIKLVEPTRFCPEGSLLDAEARFMIYRMRSFVSG